MNITKLRFCAVVIIIAGSIVTPWLIWRQARFHSLERQTALRQQAEQFSQLSDENERLSNLVTQAQHQQTLPEGQQRELMRLRSEVGKLRQVVKETEKLREANQKLQAASVKGEKPPFSGQSTADYWIKDQIAYSGYASPESAMKTALWAMHNGNADTMLACMTPEASIEMEKERQKDGKSREQMATEFKQMAESLTAPSSAFRLIDEKTISPDTMILNLSFEGEGKARKFVLRKVGNDWKVQQMLFAGQDEP